MKKYLQIVICLITGLIVTSNIFAQTAASATWSLNTTTTNTSTVVGNVTGANLAITGALVVRDYTSATGGGARLWLNNTPWPNETAINTARYYQYEISPVSGNNLTITNISMDIAGGGTGNMHCMIYYSTDPSFDPSASGGTLIGDYSASGAMPNGTWLSPTWTVSQTVLSGQTFYLRIYPYYTGSASATRYIWNRNVVISGTTVVPTSYALNTTTVGSGTVSLSPAGGSYVAGTNVTMTAVSSPVWFFQGWTGDAAGTDSSKIVTVNSNMSVTATFRRNVTLTTNATGSGSVTVARPGPYLNTDTVTVRARSAAGWDFSNWTGDLTGNDSNKVMTLGNTNQTVTAVFKKYAQLTVTHEGPMYADNVTPAPSPNGKYELNTAINLNPNLHPSWQVSKIIINGIDTSVVSLNNYKIQKHTTIKYIVAPRYPQYTLSVTSLGGGKVEITPEPYNGTYDANTNIFLKAIPEQEHRFVAWGGELNSYQSEQRIAIQKNTVIFASFEKIEMTDEPASATWQLISDGSVTVKGDIEAPEESLVGTEINQYSGFEGAQRIRMAGTNNSWAANLTEQIEGVYVQFSATPKAEKTFTVRTVSLNLGAHSTNTMKANVWYSTNADFSQAIQVPFTTGKDGNYLVKDGATVVLASPNITLKEGETFYLRVYPWHEAPSVSTGKYATIKNVVISNTISGGEGGGEATIPALSILEVRSITTKSAICKSVVTDDGGSDLTAVGLCWSTDPEPTIEDNFSYDGNIVGEFSTYITGLVSGTLYYVRAYATNEVGTAYSEETTITTNALFFKLYTNIIGSGKITVSPESNNLLFEQNSNIKLTAVPDVGWKFVGWSGDVTGTESTIDISMDTLKNVTATFEIFVGVESENEIPIKYSLKQNYPNPFNPVTKIKYALPERANVKLSVYDLLAREIVVLVNGTKEAGWYEVSFDGANLSSGTYFYKLEAGNYVEVKKLLLIK